MTNRQRVILLALLGSLLAMRGSFDEAREVNVRGRAMLEELGLGVEVARASLEAWRIEMYAGAAAQPRKMLREAYDILVAVGEKYPPLRNHRVARSNALRTRTL